MEVLDLRHALEYAGIALALACMFLLCSLKPMAIVQQCGYRNKKMLKWYARKDNFLSKRYCLLFLMLFLSAALIGICFAFLGSQVAHRLTLIPFLFFCPAFYFADKKYALKVPIRETERIKRLALAQFFVLAVALYLLVSLLNVLAYLIGNELVEVWKYIPLSLFPLLLPYLLCVSNFFDGPIERGINRKYVTHAREKLQKSQAIKIGITGSFGKTSVKNILAEMLKEKYKVLSTPASYNTPLGIAKCVNDYAGEPYEVFIAEMGARNQGDIAELCEIVRPQYAVLTGVCGQHLETFGSVENVLKTKCEILAGTNAGGTVVIGKDEYTATAQAPEDREIVWVGKENVADVVATAQGVSFTLLYDDKKLPLKTKLLGAHTAKNVALAAVLALRLGVSEEGVQRAVEGLEYVPHRLQVMKGAGGVTVIDDAYNANVKGAAEAVEVLKSFSGRKIVVTPGIVELGVLEEQENAEFGGQLVGLDLVVLVGETLVGVVKQGYLAAQGDPQKLQVFPTLEQAKTYLAGELGAGDTVLFLNDLPDVY